VRRIWFEHVVTLKDFVPSSHRSFVFLVNGIAAPAAGTDGHWPTHATAPPMYRTQVSITVTGSMSYMSVLQQRWRGAIGTQGQNGIGSYFPSWVGSWGGV
jgi:hypothetical protein